MTWRTLKKRDRRGKRVKVKIEKPKKRKDLTLFEEHYGLWQQAIHPKEKDIKKEVKLYKEFLKKHKGEKGVVFKLRKGINWIFLKNRLYLYRYSRPEIAVQYGFYDITTGERVDLVEELAKDFKEWKEGKITHKEMEKKHGVEFMGGYKFD